MILTDFQVHVGVVGVDPKPLNAALFPIYEAVRLWLRERTVVAPFRKVLVSLKDRATSERSHGHTMVALSICEVTEAVTLEDLVGRRGDHSWVCERVVDGLGHIAASTRWEHPELVALVKSLPTRSPLCAHVFPRFRRQDRQRGWTCDMVLEADVGLTSVKARFSAEGREPIEVVVASRPGPLFLEDDLPVRSTRVVDGHFVLLARDKTELARVAIPRTE